MTITYTKEDREKYNANRARICKALGIDKNAYNWFRRKGELLLKVYEDSCNGIIDEFQTSVMEKEIASHADSKAEELGLYVYYQTDPRGATIYLDIKPIPRNSYNNAYCIY